MASRECIISIMFHCRPYWYIIRFIMQKLYIFHTYKKKYRMNVKTNLIVISAVELGQFPHIPLHRIYLRRVAPTRTVRSTEIGPLLCRVCQLL